MIECVPNFSEGRDSITVGLLRQAISSFPGAHLLDSTSDADHNRTVVTVAGDASPVRCAAVAAAAVAVERIDLTRHSGVHPRIGALDVLPFVPLGGSTLEECARLAVETAEEIWDTLRVPAYLYEAAARTPERKALENIRHPAFAGPPDIGEGRHATAGAVVVGARNILVAWNIWLATADISVAKNIARAIRASSGGFPGVKALGLPLPARGLVQVSINTTDFVATPLHVVFTAVEERARQAGVAVAGSELIGLVPERALELSAGHDLRWLNVSPESVLERRLAQMASQLQ